MFTLSGYLMSGESRGRHVTLNVPLHSSQATAKALRAFAPWFAPAHRFEQFRQPSCRDRALIVHS